MSTPPFPTAVRRGDTIYTSGLAAFDVATMRPTSTEFDAQCADVLAQLDAVLIEFGGDRTGVLELECLLADRVHFPAWNAAFVQFFGTDAPARTANRGPAIGPASGSTRRSVGGSCMNNCPRRTSTGGWRSRRGRSAPARCRALRLATR